MILAFALAAAVLFGCGAYLLLKRDLVRVVAGIMLISQCAMVTIIGSSLSRGPAAIGVQPGDHVSDPLPQALGLTALVIGLATVALLLALVHRVVTVFRTAERDELAAGEAQHEAGLEPQRRADREETVDDPAESPSDTHRVAVPTRGGDEGNVTGLARSSSDAAPGVAAPTRVSEEAP